MLKELIHFKKQIQKRVEGVERVEKPIFGETKTKVVKFRLVGK